MMRILKMIRPALLAAFLCLAEVQAQRPAALLHQPAPQFVRTDLSGGTVDLKSQRGKVVLLNFWATWCAPCQLELPKFKEWQRQYAAQGFQVLARSMDDDAAPVRARVRRLRLDFPVLMGDEKLGSQYGGVLGLPLTFVIDRKGVVVAQFKGETDLSKMESTVRKVLAK
jgi:peroxiredoxin